MTNKYIKPIIIDKNVDNITLLSNAIEHISSTDDNVIPNRWKVTSEERKPDLYCVGIIKNSSKDNVLHELYTNSGFMFISDGYNIISNPEIVTESVDNNSQNNNINLS